MAPRNRQAPVTMEDTKTVVDDPKRRVTIVEKLIAICGVLALMAVAYLFYRASVSWYWTIEVWWHWGLAFLVFCALLLLSGLVIMGTISLIMTDGSESKRQFWWTTAAFIGSVAVVVLFLWALMPRPTWWASWHRWIWGGALSAVSIVSTASRMFGIVQDVGTPKVRDKTTFQHEWRFNNSRKQSPSRLGIAMSGGGIRSAAFNLGALQALHENGILRSIDVMSSVSGGSYTMSWYLLQPFYAAQAASKEGIEFNLDKVIGEMFRSDGRFQSYLCRHSYLVVYPAALITAALGATFEQVLRAFSTALGAHSYNNVGMLRGDYRTAIQKVFHGHPVNGSTDKIKNGISFGARSRSNIEDRMFTVVHPVTYQELAEFAEQKGLPFFIVNAAVLVERPKRDMLWPTAFELTANDLGADVFGYRSWADVAHYETRQPDQRRWSFGPRGIEGPPQ